MRATHFVRSIAFLTALAAGAMAQPPPRGRRAMAAVIARQNSASAIAYMSGKQALVGMHAPSTKAVQREESGRPLLGLTTLNRGESLAIAAARDDGGFAAADLDRVAHLLRASGGEEHPIDPRTLSLVYVIQIHFGVPEISVVSGYRVPKPGSRSTTAKVARWILSCPASQTKRLRDSRAEWASWVSGCIRRANSSTSTFVRVVIFGWTTAVRI